MFRKLKLRLSLMRQGLFAKPLKEASFAANVAGRQLELSHSRFNTRWLNQLGLQPQVIVDLGSFDGGDAIRFADHFPAARVVTVEADPKRIDNVQSNLAGSRVEVEHIAVCEHDGTVDWFTSTIDGEVNAQGSIFSHSQEYREQFSFVEQAEQPKQVPATRFDSLCDRLGIDQIDLLHMDIEGAEYTVLQGLGSVRPKAIFLETCDGRFLGAASVAETHNLLAELGYELKADLGTDRLYFHAAAQGTNRKAA